MKNLSKDKMNESISSLLVQIKEMKKKNKKIEQEKNKLVIENRELKKFFDITIDLLCIADTNGYFRKLNAEWEKTLGYSLEELEGSRFLDFIHPDDIISTLDAIKELSSQKEVLNFVNRYRCKDGSYKWIEWRSKPSGEMIFAAARDITERKISETIRKETDEYNEMIFQHTPVAKVVMDENGRFLRCNEFAAKVFGYESAAELLQKTPWELSTPQQKNGKESEKYSLEIIRSILISMKPVEFEWQHKKPNGEIWDGQVYLYPFIHKDQKRLYFTIRDITVQKKTQDFQRLNEIRLEAMLKLQSMKDCDVKEITDFTLEYAVSITDSSLGYIAFLNNEQDVLTMNSWSKEAMKECAIENKPIIYPVINTGLWGEAIRQRKPIITNDYLAPNEFKKGTPKGHVNLLRHMNVPIFDGDKIVVLIGVGNKDSEYDEYDVMQLTLLTKGMWELIQRKKAEEIVQQNESRLRQIIDLVPHFIFAKNRDGKFILANKAVADTFGVSVNELLGKTDADFNPDMAMVEHFRNDDLEVIEKGKPIFIPEEKITDSKGNIKYLETTKIPFKLSETQEDVVLGTSTDITERKTSEKALLESEKLYRSVIENIQDVFYKSDKEGRLIMGSPSGGKMFGYDNIEEIIGKHLDSFWANPEKRSDLDQKMRVNGSVSDYECVMLRKDGSSFDVSLTAHFLYDEKGNILGTEGIIRDITKRKQAEEALRESEKRFREMMDFLPESIYESDVNGIITYANKTALSVFGYEESDFSKNIKITELLIPEDRERALNNRELAYKEKSRTIEYTGLRKDGSTLPVLIHTIAVFKNGQICGTRGVIIDVTEQKKAEEALRSSEEKFRSLIQNSSDVITILNSKGLIMYISPSSERVLKRKPDEMIGKSPIEYIHPEDLDLVNKALKEVYEYNNDGIPTEFRFRGGNGNWIYLETIANNLLNYPGINGIVITSRDITDRILSIEALKDSERQFRAFLNSTDDMAFLKDSEERYIFVNYALSEFFGRNEEEILGKTDYSLMSKELADICHNTDLRALNSDDVVISEEEDSGFIFETRKFKLLLKNNKIGIGGLIRNITEKRKLEKQIIQSEKMSVVGQLAGGIAHDLNNILTALIGNTELLEKKLCDNCRKDSFRYIDALLKANSKAKNIILQILAFSKGQPIEKEIVDINDIVNDMGKMLSRLIPENIKIVKKVEEIKLFINADISQVEQIIMNLVINSRDAIPGQGTIEIITREQKVLYDTITKNGIIKPGEYAQLSIKDSGSGIAPAIIDKIFDPFFTTKEIGKGTGLGLSVVINNVNKNSGYINVYSEVGKGTEIKIYFKIVSEEEKLLTAIKQEELLFGNREKILIVEDDEGIRFMLTEYLRDLNYDITFAGNGIEAMEILNRFQIDAIITDLTMPDMGGLDLYRNVKNKMPNLPIIAMTGYYDYKELAGFDFHEVLDKPLDMTRVSIILKRLFKDKLK